MITGGDSNATGFQSGNAGSVAANNACALNDLIEVQFLLFNASGPNVPPVITDTVNSGSYITVATLIDSPNDWLYGKAYIVCNGVGTPTINVASNAADFSGMELAFSRFTGFLGVPTLDAGATSLAPGNSGTCAGSFVSTQPNELVIANGITGNTPLTVGGSGWNANAIGGALAANVYQVIGSPGSTSFSATLPSAAAWDVMLSGYYDLVQALQQKQSLGGGTFQRMGLGLR